MKSTMRVVLGAGPQERAVTKRLLVAIARLALAFLVVVIFGLLTAREVTRQISSATHVSENKLVSITFELVLNIGIERGRSAIYLAANNASFISYNYVLTNRIPVDVSISRFHEASQGAFASSPAVIAANQAIKMITDIRLSVEKKDLSPHQVIYSYSAVNDKLLDVVFYYYGGDREFLPRLAMARLGEAQGIFRSTLSAVIVVGYWEAPIVIDAVKLTQTQMLFFINDFNRSATDDDKQYYQMLTSFPESVRAQEQVDYIANYALGFTNATIDAPFEVNTTYTDLNASMAIIINNTRTTFSYLAVKLSGDIKAQQNYDTTSLAIVVVGCVIELVAAVQLAWMAVPILKFYILTRSASRDESNTAHSQTTEAHKSSNKS